MSSFPSDYLNYYSFAKPFSSGSGYCYPSSDYYQYYCDAAKGVVGGARKKSSKSKTSTRKRTTSKKRVSTKPKKRRVTGSKRSSTSKGSARSKRSSTSKGSTRYKKRVGVKKTKPRKTTVKRSSRSAYKTRRVTKKKVVRSGRVGVARKRRTMRGGVGDANHPGLYGEGRIGQPSTALGRNLPMHTIPVTPETLHRSQKSKFSHLGGGCCGMQPENLVRQKAPAPSQSLISKNYGIFFKTSGGAKQSTKRSKNVTNNVKKKASSAMKKMRYTVGKLTNKTKKAAQRVGHAVGLRGGGPTGMPMRWFDPNWESQGKGVAVVPPGWRGASCMASAYGQIIGKSFPDTNLAPFPNATGQQTGGEGKRRKKGGSCGYNHKKKGGTCGYNHKKKR